MVLLDIESEQYIKELIAEFEASNDAKKFDHVIHPPIEKSYLPSLFFWSPLLTMMLNIVCPIHTNTFLKPASWTCDVTKPNSSRSPRLIFCLRKNYILVQRLYFCYHQKEHYYLSASQDIIETMSQEHLSLYLPFRKFHKSAYSKLLMEHVYNEILCGVNFTKIASGLSSFRNSEFRKNVVNKCSIERDNVLYSVPSCSSIKAVFLDFFQYNKPYYDNANKLPTFSISTDHTFKSAKPIGGYTLDGKFVKDLNKLFIILNENDKVVDWQLTKTNSQAEVRPILEKLNAQLKSENCQLKFIFADLCCEWVAFYISIFFDSKTKLDLFHACQRVCKVVPHKKTIEALKFMKEFGLIFRQVGDLSDFRCLTTDTVENIFKNLDMFLEGQSKYLETMVTESQKKIILNEIDKIRNHIVLGCLSGIPPGCGTGSNERLHRMLNRSFLRGSTLISPELAQAVLTLIFYSYNEDRKENGQVFSLLPVFHKPFSTRAKYEYTELTSKGKLQTSTLQINGFENLVKTILKRTRIVISNISKVSNLCQNKILKEQLLMHLHFDRKVSESFQDVSFEFHCHTLKRNLASFGLTEDEVSADGDCLFRSIALQLKKILNASMADSPLKFHLSNIGINLDQDDIDIIMKLRNRFVDTLTTSITLKPFLTKADLHDASNFRKRGVFASNVGDLVVDVVCDIIGMTIVVVSSSSLVDVSVHCPKEKQYAEQPIFISHNRFGSGHYNSTKDIKVTDDPNVRCNCRRNVNDTMPCDKQDSLSRCPCVQRNTSCSKKCYCRCCNNKSSSLELHNLKCMCGKNNKTSTASCTDKSGLRASKCPCLRSGKACNSTCKCKNCANDFGIKESINGNDLVVSRKPRRDTIYKPLRTTDYMLQENKELVEGPWTLVETSCLVCCINVVKCLDPDASYDNIATVFNQVVVSPSLSLFDFVLRTKSGNQIRAKLDHLKKWKS